MPEQVQLQDDPTPETPEAVALPSESRPDLPADEALALIVAGKPLENVRVRRLKLRGEFVGPVLFRNCTLIQPELAGGVINGGHEADIDTIMAG